MKSQAKQGLMMSKTGNKHLFVNFFRLFVFLGIFFVIDSAAVLAQEDDLEKHLLKSIEQTRQQLEAEQQRIAREQQAQENDLKEGKIQQEQLVDEIVELKFAVARREKSSPFR